MSSKIKQGYSVHSAASITLALLGLASLVVDFRVLALPAKMIRNMVESYENAYKIDDLKISEVNPKKLLER